MEFPEDTSTSTRPEETETKQTSTSDLPKYPLFVGGQTGGSGTLHTFPSDYNVSGGDYFHMDNVTMNVKGNVDIDSVGSFEQNVGKITNINTGAEGSSGGYSGRSGGKGGE